MITSEQIESIGFEKFSDQPTWTKDYQGGRIESFKFSGKKAFFKIEILVESNMENNYLLLHRGIGSLNYSMPKLNSIMVIEFREIQHACTTIDQLKMLLNLLSGEDF